MQPTTRAQMGFLARTLLTEALIQRGAAMVASPKVEHDAGDRETVPAIYAFRTPLGTAEIRLPPDPTDNTPLLGVHINFRNEPPNKWADLYPSGHVMIAEYVGADPTDPDPTTADTVEAQEVKVGDRIYNASAQKWVQVKSIAAHEGYVILETPAWSTWKRPTEAVAVDRGEGAGSVNEFVTKVLASIDTMRAGKPAPRAENPIRPRPTRRPPRDAYEVPCPCGAGGAEWRDVGTGGRSYMCDACAAAASMPGDISRETGEMTDMLRQHGFMQPEKAARRLVAEGMGPEELRSRLQHPAGSVGSLEHSHGLQRVRGRAGNPIRPRSTAYASEIPCSCGAGGAEWRDMGTGGRSYMCDACAAAVSETEEMAEMLRQHDFVQPEHAARKLAADGIGLEELRSRLRHPAGSVGSLEYTHGLQSARGRAGNPSHGAGHTVGMVLGKGMKAVRVEVTAKNDGGFGEHAWRSNQHIPEHQMRELRGSVSRALEEIGHRLNSSVSLKMEDEIKSTHGLDMAVLAAVLIAQGVVPQSPANWVYAAGLSSGRVVSSVRGIAVFEQVAEEEDEVLVIPMLQAMEVETGRFVPVMSVTDLVQVMETPRAGWDMHGRGAPRDRGADPKEWMHDMPPGKEIDHDLVSAIKWARSHQGIVIVVRQRGDLRTVRDAARAALGAISAKQRNELRRIYSAAGMNYGISGTLRPFRAPHHTVSERGIAGDGYRPGEADLARHGVLILDEADEMRRGPLSAAIDARKKDVVVIALVVPSPGSDGAAQVQRVLRASPDVPHQVVRLGSSRAGDAARAGNPASVYAHVGDPSTFAFRAPVGPTAVRQVCDRLRRAGIQCEVGTEAVYGSVRAESATDAERQINRAAGFRLMGHRSPNPARTELWAPDLSGVSDRDLERVAETVDALDDTIDDATRAHLHVPEAIQGEFLELLDAWDEHVRASHLDSEGEEITDPTADDQRFYQVQERLRGILDAELRRRGLR